MRSNPDAKTQNVLMPAASTTQTHMGLQGLPYSTVAFSTPLFFFQFPKKHRLACRFAKLIALKKTHTHTKHNYTSECRKIEMEAGEPPGICMMEEFRGRMGSSSSVPFPHITLFCHFCTPANTQFLSEHKSKRKIKIL